MSAPANKAASVRLKSPRTRVWAARAGEAFEPKPQLLMGCLPPVLRVRARGAVAIDVPRTTWLAASPFAAEPPAPRFGVRGAGTTERGL